VEPVQTLMYISLSTEKTEIAERENLKDQEISLKELNLMSLASNVSNLVLLRKSPLDTTVPGSDPAGSSTKLSYKAFLSRRTFTFYVDVGSIRAKMMDSLSVTWMHKMPMESLVSRLLDIR
jgi:hypothetical protein